MRIILLTFSMLTLSLHALAQEKKVKELNPNVEVNLVDDHDARIQMLQNEITDTKRRLNEMNTAIVPKNELDRSIYKAKISELEFLHKWKQKELRLAQSEKAGNDISGLRGEVKALKERYTAMRDNRLELENDAAAKKAEIDDEKPAQNAKLKMQRTKLKDEIQLKKYKLKREENSATTDTERIVQLKGEIEALQRQVDELKE